MAGDIKPGTTLTILLIPSMTPAITIIYKMSPCFTLFHYYRDITIILTTFVV
jgi:hypothetical protein